MAPGSTYAPVGQPASRSDYFSGIPGIDKNSNASIDPPGALK